MRARQLCTRQANGVPFAPCGKHGDGEKCLSEMRFRQCGGGTYAGLFRDKRTRPGCYSRLPF